MSNALDVVDDIVTALGNTDENADDADDALLDGEGGVIDALVDVIEEVVEPVEEP